MGHITMAKTIFASLSSAALFLLSLGVSWADESTTPATTSFDIPPQNLEAALIRFSEQSDIQLVMASADVDGKQVEGVVGDLTHQEALIELLGNTGLEYQFVNDETVAIGVADERGDSEEKNLRPIPVLMAQNQTSQSTRTTEVSSSSENTSEAAAEESQLLEEIVVTGTRIRGIEDGPSPVLTFSRDDIDATGVSTLREFVATIPQSFGGGGNAGNQIRATGTGSPTLFGFGTEINLRGLGSGTTLTLLNGRRLATSEEASIVDISVIPPSAVERIEVLTDGASAIYGSDAVGGVVNVILRDDFEGFETRARYGGATRSGGTELGFSQAAGTNWGSGNAFLTLDYFSQEDVAASDRSFSENADFLPIDLVPGSERISAYGTVSQEIVQGVTVSADGFYTQREVDFTITSVTGQSENDAETEFFGGNLSVIAELSNDWLFEVAGGYSQNALESLTERVLSSTGGIQTDERGNETYNWFVEAKVDGALFTIPGGDVKVALGASFRKSELTVSPLVRDGVSFGDGDEELGRDVSAAFAEVYIPIVGEENRFSGVEQLAITAAARYDEYSDFGGTFNPKIGALWGLTPDLLIRGTYGTSFRAPVLADLDPTSVSVQLGSFPDDFTLRDNFIPTLFVGGGNPSLEPEDAEIWTVGTEWNPSTAPGLSFEVNYYNIEYSDRIRRSGSVRDLSENIDGVFDPVITLNPTVDQLNSFIALDLDGPLIRTTGTFGLPDGWELSDIERILDGRITNLSDTTQSGIDFRASYEFPMQQWDVLISLDANYIIDSSERITATSPEVDAFNRIFRPTDLTTRGQLRFSNGGFTASVFGNFVSGYDNDFVQPIESVDAWTTFDLALSYEFPESIGSIFDGLKVSMNVRNVFDEDPPGVSVDVGRGTGFDPTNANPLGRFVSVQFSKKW